MKEMDEVHNLYSQFLANVFQLEQIEKSIEKLKEDNNLEELEKLYENEFRICMDHAGIFEDLLKQIDKVPVTNETVFELKKIKRDIKKMSRVMIVEL